MHQDASILRFNSLLSLGSSGSLSCYYASKPCLHHQQFELACRQMLPSAAINPKRVSIFWSQPFQHLLFGPNSFLDPIGDLSLRLTTTLSSKPRKPFRCFIVTLKICPHHSWRMRLELAWRPRRLAANSNKACHSEPRSFDCSTSLDTILM